jgi:hypothetical protein
MAYRDGGSWKFEHPNAMDGTTYDRLVQLVSVVKQHAEYLTRTTPDVVPALDNPAQKAKTDPVYAGIVKEYQAMHPEAGRKAKTTDYITRALRKLRP